jgi:flagellar basal-body rod modification protein FlgD
MASGTTLTSNPSGVLQPTPAPGTQYPSSSTSASSGSNELDPNSFITLLTAQLQAQDPLNPMDPSQMVSELTQINSLQQLVQIQSDLQTMLGPSSSSTAAQDGTASSGTSGTGASSSV